MAFRPGGASPNGTAIAALQLTALMTTLIAMGVPVKPFGDPGLVGWIVFGAWVLLIIAFWVRHVRNSNRDK